MKFIQCIALAFIGCTLPIAESADLSTSALARHLGISYWQSKVDLQPGTFGAAVSEIRNGVLVGSVGTNALTGPSEDLQGQDIYILASNTSNGTKLTLIIGSSSLTTSPTAESSTIDLPATSALPDSISAGTFVLGGDYAMKDGTKIATGKIEDIVSGLALIIHNNTAEQGAAANP